MPSCCGVDGWCGYSPTYCGEGCQSNCDAKAECGEYAKTPGQTCPLNVCCSEFGFCGTTTDFCTGGCQSNCEQPKPNSSPSDVQKRVIGYWETWNMQKPCGTMGPGEIPVHLLTHLFVSFGYINDAFQVTNMDGIDPGLYKSIGNVKARNPSLKVVIALGGWTFSDPGPWQKVFPALASTKENRATFIPNLVGFLSEYGYDGVGADDRGSSDGDGENYTALLTELREAINASGKDYIVTFTAPSSYWYLRHFDLKGMEAQVDWINLMSYDLHGIDHALDLFWRVGVEPSSVVLGLGFYGRSFELESVSCWKPGCAFKGPGAAGRCSNTAGILSYSEIMEILENTGATAYHDEAATAQYLVDADNSWISFDDVTTFQAKIDYANSMGLAGIMIWAIDLDTGKLDALKAISSGTKIGGTNTRFTMVDLDRLFSADMLPSDNDPMSYGLVNLGAEADAGEIDPDKTGFGFMLLTGDSYAVASLKKRHDNPNPLIFIDCPEKPNEQDGETPQKARVACFSDDIKGCFQLMERGVEGTIIEMPDNCAAGSFARAISIEVSEDQSIPIAFSSKEVTSDVFTLTFDLDLTLARRDTTNTRIRVDYSNIRGYWNAAVDSPGIEGVSKRFHAPTAAQWRNMFTNKVGTDMYVDAFEIKEQLTHVEGTIDAKFYYGYSMVATFGDRKLDVSQASGFLSVRGNTDLTFTVGGVGEVDLDKTRKGNPATTNGKTVIHRETSVDAGDGGTNIDLSPYYTINYSIGSFNDTDGGSASPSGPYFDGKLSTRVISDFGDFNAYFPTTKEDRLRIKAEDRLKNRISIPDDNVLHNASGLGGRISMGALVKFGMKIKTSVYQNVKNSRSAGWSATENMVMLASDRERQGPADGKVCYPNASPSAGVMPGWGYNADTNVDPTRFVGSNYGKDFGSKSSLQCSNCLSCGAAGKDKPGKCCGCPSLDKLYPNNEDMPPCEWCTKSDGPWPGSGIRKKRDEYHNDTDVLDHRNAMEIDEEIEDDDDDGLGTLDKRAWGTATPSSKGVSVCGRKVRTFANSNYPPFPRDASFPWEGIDNGEWDDISRYWGNGSAVCSDWSIKQLQQADTIYTGASGVSVRAPYDNHSEPTFAAANGTRPNQKKGRMFGGIQPNAMDKCLVFEYINNIAVWQKFCATYEGIYDLLGEFDTWYSRNGLGVTIPNLQAEWRACFETVLRSMVLRTRDTYNSQRAAAVSDLSSNNAADDVFLRHWAINDLINKARIRITGSCDRLSKTAV
ncbi:chitinase [Colletotrichum sojae]|uniref:chitinase n=1 Tax=Colletotrichum sojae TaxID=2175907 RepID=A0A8H6MHV1_9PEZI|nr:chitinase [Colletotrichum sojae]